MRRKDLFGHPLGLYILFLTEMWERFSYYGMRALLILYLTKHFLFSDAQAGMIYGSYVALIYGLPLIGGIIADRYLGMKKAITFGAVLLVLGHISMAFEGPGANNLDGSIVRDQNYLNYFFLSISLIAVGVGFLKANISNLVGTLYSKKDGRRDSGFTIFYMGINLGAFVATLMCAYLGETYGWKYGFGVAGIGMVLGLFTFIKGTRILSDKGNPPDPQFLEKRFLSLKVENLIYLSSLLFVLLIWVLFQVLDNFGILLLFVGLPVIIWLIFFLFTQCNRVERNQTFSILVLMAFSVFFWALFEQAASSITLFTDRNVQLIDGVSAGMFQALNPLFIVLFAPVFAYLWVYLDKKNIEPNATVKFAMAILFISIGFFSLVVGSGFAGDDFKVSLIFLVVMYLFHTFGELCLSPVGLSMVTRLSIVRIAGLMMGIWFLSSSLAGYVSGLIAGLMSIPTDIVDIQNKRAASLEIYSSNFETLGMLALVVSLFLFLISPIVSKYMKD